ncbi:hypothetical protein CHF27_003010 [Romboutsia maritimum]|uniref:Uncharacterized protein n=1 Tax=Romboutsia maritimum TaxID=2020948 RepID=A0A371IV47_9FIRM|nr:DUF6483 family protein [Romboutsia maritimum]RDY24341.1 hypothetical protein CHF27_003010 [Romboutsia maritimum]
MEYKQDWLLRQIENISRLVASLIFNTSTITYEINDKINLSETDMLYKEISLLLRKNKICEAEDLLFRSLEESNKDYLRLGIDFYQTINELDDDKLKECNFSRKEIMEGLTDLLEIYKVPNFII